MKLVSFVIPVYHNEGSLAQTHEEICKVLEPVRDRYDYEFYFVNDGSKDGSLNELLDIRKRDPKVKVVDFSRNFGQAEAIIGGISQVKGDVVISLSADLQDPVGKIPEMLQEYENGNDVIICNRPHRDDGFMNDLFARLFYQLMKTSKIKIPEGGFDLFLLSKRAYNVLLSLNEHNRYLHADILWLGFSVKLIPTIRRKRTVGKSQYNFIKRVNSLLLCYFNTSYAPIRAMSVIGIFTALTGFLYALFIVFAYFKNNVPFNGWAPIMILVLIIGGLIMIMLGIIGEYIWRIYDETKKRPYFIIKDKYE